MFKLSYWRPGYAGPLDTYYRTEQAARSAALEMIRRNGDMASCVDEFQRPLFFLD